LVEFEATWGYPENSRLSWATYRDLVSKAKQNFKTRKTEFLFNEDTEILKNLKKQIHAPQENFNIISSRARQLLEI
jgi:predicted oxidoreductase (fatty acid repression mutant protein)